MQGDGEMKINKKIIRVILIATLIIICNSCICHAANGKLPTLGNYEPPAQGGTMIEATNIILGVIIVVGVVLIVVFIALAGFNMITGSVEEKAITKEKFGGYFIAAIVLIGGASLAKILIAIAETF